MRMLSVVVALTEPLHTALEAEPARLRITKELADVAADFGVSVGPEVRFASLAEPSRGQPLRVHVDGRLCLTHTRRTAEALAYATGSHVRVNSTAADLLDDVAPDELHETLATVVRAAVTARPEVLVEDGDPLGVLLDRGVSLAGADLDALREEVRSGRAEAAVDRLTGPLFDLRFEPEYLEALTVGRDAAELFTFLRDGMLTELGLLLPPMHVRLDPTLRPRGFAFQVNAIQTIPRIGLELDEILVNDTPERLGLMGVAAVPAMNPATGQPAGITSVEHRTLLEAAGLTVWDAFGFHILVMAEFIRHHARALMSPAQVRTEMTELGKAFPVLTASFDDSDVAVVIGPLLRSLLGEQISIRNLRHILQLVRRHTVAPETNFGDDLTTFVRKGLSDQIGNVAARGTNTLVAFLLDARFEDEVAACVDRGDQVPVKLAEDIRDATYREATMLPRTASLPALLTADKCRSAVREILYAEFPSIRVLGYRDLPGHLDIQPIARISR